MKILIAEDEYTTRLMIQVCLEKWGYRVDSVADGKEAWELLKGENAPIPSMIRSENSSVDSFSLGRVFDSSISFY